MPHRHKCIVCGKQAIASNESEDGGLVYLCADHLPKDEIDPFTGKSKNPASTGTPDPDV